MMAMKDLSAQTGYDISNLEKDLETFDKFKVHMQNKGQISSEISNQIEKTKLTQSKTIQVNKQITYQGIQCTIHSISLDKKNEDSTKLTIFITAENKTNLHKFIFWNEECRILYADDIITLDDYKLETDYKINTKSEGYLIFLIPNDLSIITLQFGKKSSPSSEIKIECN